MKSIFNKLGSSIYKNPFKLLFLAIIVTITMGIGATNIQLSTGYDTLVQPDQAVYIHTTQMEETFGGDSILVLLESNTNLLHPDVMMKLYEIEEQLSYNPHIFSITSPASILAMGTQMQSEMLISNVREMSTGLSQISSILTDVSRQLQSIDMMDPNEMAKKLENLSLLTSKFSQLSAGQSQLNQGLSALESHLSDTSQGIHQITLQLATLSNQLPENQKLLLDQMSEKLSSISNGLGLMSENTQPMQDATRQTATSLTQIQSTLSHELSVIQSQMQSSISPEQLKDLAVGFKSMGDNLGEISNGLSMIANKSAMMKPTIVTTQNEVDQLIYDENHQIRTIFEDVILDDNQLLMVIKLNGNLEDQTKESVTNQVMTVFDQYHFEKTTLTISGKSVLDLALKSAMKSNMMFMVALSVVFMFLVLSLVFKVKWRMLSLGVIFVSVIATLGFMGWINVPVTMVSMAVFPILIGLGIDYSIQFHNRFEENDDVTTTAKHIGKAVFIAVVATGVGFISLFISPVPMIQDFGKMLSIGVVVAFAGSIFLLLPTLRAAQFVQNKEKTDRYKPKALKSNPDTLFSTRLTKHLIKFRYIILVIFVVFTGLGLVVDSKISVETNIETFMPQNLEALEDLRHLRDTVGSTDQLIVYFKDDNVLTQTNYDYIEYLSAHLITNYSASVVAVKGLPYLLNQKDVDDDIIPFEVLSSLPDKQLDMFINEATTETILIVQLADLSTEELNLFTKDLQNQLTTSPMEAHLTGKTMLDVEMVNGLTDGRIKMTLLGLILVFIALALLYRNVIKALIPIIPVLLIIGISSGLMYLLQIQWTPITATLGALVLGMGTEMTVMMMERYLEERKNRLPRMDALSYTTSKIGKAILASGLTTMGGFSVLIFSSFVILKDFGIMTMINIALAIVATFMIMPPLLYILDPLLIKKEKRISHV